tara:strand:- start:3220 stop:3879 length:660 start_codon:yes stop_codon:yes gene_type:complete
MNHAILPSRQGASLPAKYEAAKIALKECNKIDECKDWGDKAQALASYAKQADDKEMEKTAQRIRARAVRRCGELLKGIEKAKGKHWKSKRGDAPPSISRKQAASDAGLSPDQARQSIRVANVPKESFEDQIEGNLPPTITNLAEQGTKKAIPRYEQLGMTKKAWQAGMHFRGHLSDMARHADNFDPQEVVDGSTPKEREQMRQNIKIIDHYLDQLIAKI